MSFFSFLFSLVKYQVLATMKLVEIQSSHVGIGKSTFCDSFELLPQIDDCIDLVQCFPESWYNTEQVLFFPEKDEIIKALLILEHSCAKLDQLAKTGCDVVLASRSTLISTCQFIPHLTDENTDCLLNYFRKRIQNTIDSVVIFDYGDIVQKRYWEKGYRNMLQRNRPFEVQFFDSAQKYRQFFKGCEIRKHKVLDKLEKDSLFTYIPMQEFDGFSFRDRLAVLKECF